MGITNQQLSLLATGSVTVAVFSTYLRASREVAPNALVPDESRNEAIPERDISPWVNGWLEETFSQVFMLGVYDYMIKKSSEVCFGQNTKLKLLDCGCGTGILSFRLVERYYNVIDSVVGVDLSLSNIAKANEKLSLLGKIRSRKLNFDCKDATRLAEYGTNHFDIGYLSMVLHDMPDRVPITLMCELSRVCRNLVILDWCEPFPWNYAGVRNRLIEFLVGPKHFAGFRHFLAVGGIDAHVRALERHRSGVRVKFSRKIDNGSIGFFILNTENVDHHLSKL